MDASVRQSAFDSCADIQVDERSISNLTGLSGKKSSSFVSPPSKTKKPTPLLLVALSQPLILFPAPIKISAEIKVLSQKIQSIHEVLIINIIDLLIGLDLGRCGGSQKTCSGVKQHTIDYP